MAFDNEAIGDTFRQMAERYGAKLDPGTQTWYIVDLHSEELRSMSLDDPIENSAATTTINSAMFETLVREAARLGLLTKYGVSSGMMVESQDVSDLKAQVEYFKDLCDQYERDVLSNKINEPQSEEFKFRKLVVDSLMKLAGMSEIKSSGGGS